MFEKYQFSCRKIQIFLDHLKQKMRLLLEISIFQMAVKIKNNKKGISNTPMSLIFNLDTFHTNSYHLHTKTWPKLSVFIAKSYCLPQMPHCETARYAIDYPQNSPLNDRMLIIDPPVKSTFLIAR